MLAGSTAVSGTRAERVPAGGPLGRVRDAALAYRFLLGVGALTGAVAAFLLMRFRAWPPHEDETLVLFLSRQPLADFYDSVIRERSGAPLHFLLAHVVESLAPGLTALRLISVVTAVASIPVIAALAARLAGRRVALLATVVAAASWITLFHGIYGRMYGLFLLTSSLCFLAFLRAVERGDRRSWALWLAAALAMVATQPYGALVLGAQGVYLFARRRDGFRRRPAAIAFMSAVVVAAPLWFLYWRLASRFDVGLTGNGSKLGSPLDVVRYFGKVVGDFTVGWPPALAFVGLVALLGFVSLARSRPAAAVLVAAVFAVPAAALLGARSGASVTLESRHLIFALPFFATALAAGILRGTRFAGTYGRLALGAAAAALVAAQVAWGWHKTPALYAGEDPIRKSARAEAAAWLSASSRPDDLYFGYEPLFLDAWEQGADVRLIVQRADPNLALKTMREASKPLGRGVWIFDATDHADVARQRLTISHRSPGPAFETKAFGPFLVIRTREPVRTIESFFYETAEVQMLGEELGVGDAGINHQTALTILYRLHDFDPER
jgi:Dolichyl-phosphate-mannose-protein mannosyltransferase